MTAPADPAGLALPQGYEPADLRPTVLRLGEGRREPRRFPAYAGSDAPPPAAAEEDFVRRHIIHEERPAIVYEIAASGRCVATVVLPAAYAQALAEDGVKAFVRLAPAHLPALLAELPDPAMIGEITLHDERNPMDAWYRQARGDDFVSAAMATPDGRVSAYLAVQGDEARDLLKHEWAHILHGRLVSLDGRAPGHFDRKIEAALLAEADGFFLRDFARLDDGENFAVHLGEGFLAGDPATFVRLVAEAPVRSRCFADLLAHVLGRAAVPSPYADIYERRIRHARAATRTTAPAVLLAAANRTSGKRDRSPILSLLAHYGSGDDLAAIAEPADFRLADDPWVNARTIERIARTRRIETLDLTRARGIAPDSLALLAGTGISTLLLGESLVDDRAAGPLSRLTTLEYLNAGGTLLTDAAVPHLARLTALDALDLAGTRLSRAGTRALQRRLPKTRISF